MLLIGLLEKLVCMLVPDNSESSRERQKMDRLEERFLQHPALAIEPEPPGHRLHGPSGAGQYPVRLLPAG